MSTLAKLFAVSNKSLIVYRNITRAYVHVAVVEYYRHYKQTSKPVTAVKVKLVFVISKHRI